MESELLQRAQNVAALIDAREFTAADIKETGEVYSLLTGKKVECTSCAVLRLVTEIHRIVYPEPKKAIAMGKYQFIKKAAGMKIIRHMETGTRVITAENLNKGDNADYVLKRHNHLIELNPEFKTEEAPKVEAAKLPEQTEAGMLTAPKQGKKSHKK